MVIGTFYYAHVVKSIPWTVIGCWLRNGHIGVCVYIYIYIYIHTHTHYIYIYIYTHTHTYIHTYIHTCQLASVMAQDCIELQSVLFLSANWTLVGDR